jgi:hypothetical protein
MLYGIECTSFSWVLQLVLHHWIFKNEAKKEK